MTTPAPVQSIAIAFAPNGDTCAACGHQIPAPDVPALAFATDTGQAVCEPCAARMDPNAYRALGTLHRIHDQVDEICHDLPYLGYSDSDPAVDAYLSNVARGTLTLLNVMFHASTFFRCDTCRGWFDYSETGGRIPDTDGARHCDRCNPRRTR